MKVLFIGHYRESSGWAKAARDYILAMDSVGIDVVCRNIQLTEVQSPVPDRIVELENKSSEDCEFCIQNILPHHLIGTDLFKKNVSIFFSETTSIQGTPWFIQLQQMDEVWVPNESLWSSFSNDGMITRDGIKVLPCAFDMSKYKKDHSGIKIPEADSKFKFYYIGDLNDRKNIKATIRAFHSEFDRSEPVALILKVKKFGMSPEQTSELVSGMCNEIKHSLRMYQNTADYHQEIIIPDNMDENLVDALHDYCDCFVSPSHGEGWSIPSFDAMCFGNTPICSDFGGPSYFIGDTSTNKQGLKGTGALVGGVMSICDSADSAFPELFTGREEWFEPCEKQIKHYMRYYYENRQEINRKSGLEQGEKFSYQAVGNMIRSFLES
jgi:glycosyltransferase involved in cell wall biosynthesis